MRWVVYPRHAISQVVVSLMTDGDRSAFRIKAVLLEKANS
jgi:hypothetical protein